MYFPVDNFGTVVGENPTPYGILAFWAVNGLSIVYWVGRVRLSLSVSRLKRFFYQPFLLAQWSLNRQNRWADATRSQHSLSPVAKYKSFTNL